MDNKSVIKGVWDDDTRSFYADKVKVCLKGPLRNRFDTSEDAKSALSSVVDHFRELWAEKLPSRVLQSATIEYYSSRHNNHAPCYVIHTVLPTPKGKIIICMYQRYKTIKERGMPKLVFVDIPHRTCCLVTYTKNNQKRGKDERLYPASLFGMFTSLDRKVRKIYARDLKSDFHRRAF